jgi:Mg-chelatase subunit ChlD
MRIRHRIPSIFNLSMVDVLCCALGCVILLWLLNLRAAKDEALQASQTSQQLDDTQNDRDKLLKRLADQDQLFNTLLDDWQKSDDQVRDLQARLLQEETDARTQARRLEEVLKKLQTAEDRVKTLSAVAERVPGLEDEAKKRDRDLTAKSRDLVAARKEISDLANDKSGLEKEVDALTKELAGTRAKLKEQEKATAAARELLDMRKKELAAADAMLKERGQAVDEARDKLALLQNENDKLRDEKKTLSNEVAKVRAAAENRFEGIALTGHRVVFLVDMSGSMELVDENTVAPQKWAGVRESVARLMKSLPDLEKFQVIAFSVKPTFPLGKDGNWIDFQGKESVDQAARALAAIKPKGGTNMYAALDAAFRLRASGLDSIYLLSDGLPNEGEGATPEQQRNLKETELGEILGKHIRKKLQADWNKPARDKSRVRINAVGFFYESPDVGAFLWALSRENDGSFVGMSKP